MMLMLIQTDSDAHDMKKQLVLPGLIDAHIHVASFGKSLSCVDLTGAASISELQARLRQYQHDHPTSKWIIGRGWEQEVLGRYPNKVGP